MKPLVKLFFWLISYPLTLIMKSEIRKRPKVIIERIVEYDFALRMIHKYATGKILDVGTGHSSFPHLVASCGYNVTATDAKVGWWHHHFNRHYPVIKDDILKSKLKDKFQFITCISTIEHIGDSYTAIRNMVALLEQNGYLLLTFPYNQDTYYEDVYGWGLSYITQQINDRLLTNWTSINNLAITEMNIYKVFDSKKWGQGNRIRPVIDEKGNLMCILFQKK
jgi:2-polyprenyl-3-methyl-5-hydroxy-6-metoxy-1,4-benzoquinol methylase